MRAGRRGRGRAWRRRGEERSKGGVHSESDFSSNVPLCTANSAADLEMMFPRQRYVALEDVSRLPAVLARLYVDLTR